VKKSVIAILVLLLIPYSLFAELKPSKLDPVTFNAIYEEVKVAIRDTNDRSIMTEKGDREIRAWQRTGDRVHLDRALACMSGYRDGSIERKKAGKELQDSFFLTPSVMFTFFTLKSEGLLDKKFDSDMGEIAKDILNPESERGTNNRSTQVAAACAYAARSLPDHPEAKKWRRYAEYVWNDWWRAKDSHEVAYPRHHVEPLFNLADALEKTDQLRTGFHGFIARYRDQISPAGLMVFPGDEHPFSQSGLVEAFARAAKIFKDPTFAWAALQVQAKDSGAPTRDQLLTEFKRLGLEPRMPATQSAVALRYSNTDHAMKDKLFLSPSRAQGSPYVSFDIFDRQDKIQHGHQNQRGELIHYEADGIPLLHHLAYHVEDAAGGNIFLLSEPQDQYPYRLASPIVAQRWYRAEVPLRYYLLAAPTANFKADTRDPTNVMSQLEPLGYFNFNPERATGKVDDIELETIALRFMVNIPGDRTSAWGGRGWDGQSRVPAPSADPVKVIIDRLRLVGPKGELILEDFSALKPTMSLGFIPPPKKSDPQKVLDGDPKYNLSSSEREKWLKFLPEGKNGNTALEVTCRQGSTLLYLTGLKKKFNVSNDYTRLEFDYRFEADTRNWAEVPVAVRINHNSEMLYVDRQMGGILVDARTEQRGRDSYGTFTYRDYFTPGTKFTRQSLLTQEGILIIRDEILPGPEADGMVAGPIWHLFNPPEQGLNWFAAEGVRKEYGADKKRLLIFFDNRFGEENHLHQYGVQYFPYNEPYPAGTGRGRGRGGRAANRGSYITYSKSTLRGNQPETFVTIMVPHDTKLSAADIAQAIDSSTAKDGRTTVVIKDRLRAEIDNKGSWRVSR
jgi:hypothetical protein